MDTVDGSWMWQGSLEVWLWQGSLEVSLHGHCGSWMWQGSLEVWLWQGSLEVSLRGHCGSWMAAVVAVAAAVAAAVVEARYVWSPIQVAGGPSIRLSTGCLQVTGWGRRCCGSSSPSVLYPPRRE